MEAPAELLAALPALATALALLLAWLLVRRGAAASPEPSRPSEARGPPEPAAAPEGPGTPEGPGEPQPPGARAAAPAEAEEQSAAARQVRPGPGRPPTPGAAPRADPRVPPNRAGNRARPRAELPRGRAEPRPAGKEGPREQTHQPSPEVSPNAEAAELCSCFFCCLRSPRPQVPAPGTGHTHTSPLRPTGSQIHVHET